MMTKPKPIILDEFEQLHANKERIKALLRAKTLRKFPCKTCGLFGCICQTKLTELLNQKPKIFKDKCPNCDLFLCNCPRDLNGNRLFPKKRR